MNNDNTDTQFHNNSTHEKVRTNDPQMVVTGTIKENSKGGELITFTVPLGPFFSLACIVNVPADGDETAPVYVKFKVRKPRPQEG